jgi:hypothetical protein
MKIDGPEDKVRGILPQVTNLISNPVPYATKCGNMFFFFTCACDENVNVAYNLLQSHHTEPIHAVTLTQQIYNKSKIV